MLNYSLIIWKFPCLLKKAKTYLVTPLSASIQFDLAGALVSEGLLVKGNWCVKRKIIKKFNRISLKLRNILVETSYSSLRCLKYFS